VAHAEETGSSRELLRSLAELGHTLQAPTVAEGVERPGQPPTLLSMGFTKAQGYLFAHPMPLDQLRGFLANSERTWAKSPAGATAARPALPISTKG
jgi:EAL domain-containing protein (putative c-di-GMP-specific phosphodiesterase class I)